MQQVFDRVLTTHHLDTLIYLTLFTVICLIFLAVFDGTRSYVLTRIGRWWDETLRVEVLNAALYQSRVVGRQATSALTDLQTVRAFVGSGNVLPFFDAPWMPAFLFLIALIHPWLGAIGLPAPSSCSASPSPTTMRHARRSSRPASLASGSMPSPRRRCVTPTSFMRWACSSRWPASTSGWETKSPTQPGSPATAPPSSARSPRRCASPFRSQCWASAPTSSRRTSSPAAA